MDLFDRRAGARIKLLREKAQMKQSELAQRLYDWGLPRVYTVGQISHWETGRRTLGLREAQAIAAVLGVDMSVLLEGTEDLDLATLEERQKDALAAIAERQNANQERLDDMHARQAEIAEHQAAIAELDREIRSAGAEIDYYLTVVHDTEQRMARVNDGDEDPGDGHFEEV